MVSNRQKMLWRGGIVTVTLGILLIAGYLMSRSADTVNVATSQRESETDAESITRVIQEEENLLSAIDTPPPSTESGRRYRDDPQMPPFASVDKSGRHNSLSREQVATMKSRGRSDLQRLFTVELAEKHIRVLERAIAAQSDGGKQVRSSGGATVDEIESLKVDGDVATVTAKVTSWGTVGQIDSDTGAVRWAHPTNSIEVLLTLKRINSEWVIAERHSRFSGGGGP
jgi:hypothetical protein